MNAVTIPNDFIEALNKNKLVFFIGSGLSKKFGFPDWKRMTIDLIKEINDKRLNTFIPVLELEAMHPMKILDEIQHEKQRVSKYLNSNFLLKEDADLELHKRLIEISGKIVTTNYDNAFEMADREIESATPDSKFNISQFSTKNKFLFKLHGCAKTDASKCVLFSNQYESLYGSEQMATQKLKELFLNYKIIFIGFSFNDVYVTNLFDALDKLSDGCHERHGIVTTDPSNFSRYKYLRAIECPQHIPIDKFIESFANDLGSHNQEKYGPLSKPIEENRRTKVAVLTPAPIDLDLRQSMESFPSHFIENIDADVSKGTLNLKTLQLLDDFDYVFIVTTSFKSKLYIEDQNMRSQLVTLEEICRNIINDKTLIVFVTDKELESNTNLSFVNIASYKNQILKRFVYKTMLNGETEFPETEIKFINVTLSPKRVKKGSTKFQSLYGKRIQVEYSNKASALIGRVDEQRNLAERILALINSNKILNVKGSGGIGKTTLIKRVAYELYQRGNFSHGVSFRSCENIRTYSDFEDELISGFKYQSIVNFKEHLIENGVKLDLLIILDNFETVTNFDSKADYEKAISLLSFVSDYANIVLTSRENLNVEFEDVFPLTQMTTDDALKLFLKNYPGKVSEKEIKILRSEILENLLNNNPLAIKLVTKNSPAYGNIDHLKEQLEKHFFESTGEEFHQIYGDNTDTNIERTKSIYSTINYSYSKLPTLEKLCFEILHLLPDGISINNFKKCFSSTKSTSRISDVEIRHLSDKSLIETNDGIVQLQPIIRRFAEHVFYKRESQEIEKYCTDAYSYNCHILEAISYTKRRQGRSRALKLHDLYKNNLLYVLDYIERIPIVQNSRVPEKKFLLNYIFDLKYYIENQSQNKRFEKGVENLEDFFKDVPSGEQLLAMLRLNSIYYNRDFDSYEELSQIFPAEDMDTRIHEGEDLVTTRYKDHISTIHSMEGMTLSYVNYFVRNSVLTLTLDNDLFYLGIHSVILNKDHFYRFERDLAVGSLDISILEQHIESLFTEENLERLQCTYTLSKAKTVERDEIRKLVVTNPYTRGLKQLMLAFVEERINEKKSFFKKALENLIHIKYYYLEAIYYYSKFLFKTSDPDFDSIYSQGLQLSKKFKYQYLEFNFVNIHNEDAIYSASLDYLNIEGLEDYLKRYEENWNNYIKNNGGFD
jgi:SIR2-like domain